MLRVIRLDDMAKSTDLREYRLGDTAWAPQRVVQRSVIAVAAGIPQQQSLQCFIFAPCFEYRHSLPQPHDAAHKG
jgi:hypothetical protein